MEEKTVYNILRQTFIRMSIHYIKKCTFKKNLEKNYKIYSDKLYHRILSNKIMCLHSTRKDCTVN